MGVFLFISFTVIALLLAEFVLRLVDPQPLTRQRENKYLISENILNWSGRNHTREFNVLIEYNRLGMRGEPIEYDEYRELSSDELSDLIRERIIELTRT